MSGLTPEQRFGEFLIGHLKSPEEVRDASKLWLEAREQAIEAEHNRLTAVGPCGKHPMACCSCTNFRLPHSDAFDACTACEQLTDLRELERLARAWASGDYDETPAKANLLYDWVEQHPEQPERKEPQP